MLPSAKYVLAAMLSVGLQVPAALCESPSASEYQAKAAFLYNFTKFVEWPAQAFSGPASPLMLCVIGDEPFGPHLDAIQGRQAQGRPIAVKRLPAISQADPCHLLFISASEERRVRQLLSAVKGRALLTVGDMDHFAEMGGAINLVIDGQRVSMEVNVDVAHRHGLKISSHLLRLARVVSGEP